jgi:hypothetical protein
MYLLLIKEENLRKQKRYFKYKENIFGNWFRNISVTNFSILGDRLRNVIDRKYLATVKFSLSKPRGIRA